MFVDIHVIQTLPPSCVNRDDTGMPKTAVYGGTERARISSQSWKHAMREYFRTAFEESKLGSRTKQVPSLIADAIIELDNTFTKEKAMKAAVDALNCIGIKMDNKKKDEAVLAALFFISKVQIKALACSIVSNYTDESKIKKIDKKELEDRNKKKKIAYAAVLKDNPSIDIALFGRMAADDPSLNYDAAAQVAHAISTHEVQTEYDYFTAVDDEKAEDASGAGHLGTVAFNSATMYRYATLNVSELHKNLGDDTVETVLGFVKAFVCSMPMGKQNTFANRTLPDMVYVTIRNDQPVNLCGAFEAAIKRTDRGYVEESCRRLVSYASKVYSNFADKPIWAFGCGDERILSGHGEVLSFKKLLDSLEYYFNSCFQEDK